MFGRDRSDHAPQAKDIGLLGTDTRFEGTIRFTGTLRIDGTVAGDIASEPGSGSVLIVNQQASVAGDIVSDSVLISGTVEGNVHARERVEIFRSGSLKGDVFTSEFMIEGGAEFQGYCHMANGEYGGERAQASRSDAGGKPAARGEEQGATPAPAESEGTARA